MNHGKSDKTHRSIPVDTEAVRRLAQSPAVTSLAAIKPHIPLIKAALNRLGAWLPPDVSHSTLVGKGIMAHSYPGLFPLLCEELKRNRWAVPMSFVEQEVAGGLTHTVVGEILMRKWDMDERLRDLVLHHHQPEIDDTFTFLIGIADIVGQALYPFPRDAEYPLASALEEGTLKEARRFLPEGFFEQPLLSVEEFTTLAGAVAPRVKYLTEKMRLSVN